jgi:recombination protein RecR
MDFSSKLLENAVNEMSQLPGIGKRTALRLVLHLLKQPPQQTQGLAQSLVSLREQINFCGCCHNLSDAKLCEICANPNRSQRLVCVVED